MDEIVQSFARMTATFTLISFTFLFKINKHLSLLLAKYLKAIYYKYAYNILRNYNGRTNNK